MGVQEPFKAQKRYAGMNSADTTATQVGFYVRDFIDWYHDQLRNAPKISGRTWMTAFSALKHNQFRQAIQRGVGGYLRARDTFPNFREAADFTQMTLMNSLVMPLQIKNPADKLMTPKFIPTKLRKDIKSAKVLATFDRAEDLTFEHLPPGSYFLKSNHGSQQNLHIDLRPGADPVDLESVRKEAAIWIGEPYGKNSSQWWYQFIDRKLMIEEDLRQDNMEEPLEDLRFHCINGRVALLQLDIGLGTDHRDNPVYDGDLNYMPYNFLRANNAEAPLPALSQKARDMAAELCKPHQYVRVDFYARGNELYLGELTYLPNSGRREIRSNKLNEYLCDFWDPMPMVVGVR